MKGVGGMGCFRMSWSWVGAGGGVGIGYVKAAAALQHLQPTGCASLHMESSASLRVNHHSHIGQARPPHIRRDGPRTRMRLGDEPKRQNEGQGRADCNYNGLELGREVYPMANKPLL